MREKLYKVIIWNGNNETVYTGDLEDCQEYWESMGGSMKFNGEECFLQIVEF